ncbi:MAG TPA: hypothetical protein VN736_07200 [Candidatus Limnocylindrales bacterium]|nr:hypothetical protein [Candidatus Limnocylindrales bacterium]
MAITGTHLLIYSRQAEECRRLLQEAFGFRSVDAGGGWLIFALPPAEVGVHPAGEDGAPHHEMSLMCDDIRKTMAELEGKGVKFEGGVNEQRWGITTMMVLPGEVRMMLYQPRHPVAAS